MRMERAGRASGWTLALAAALAPLAGGCVAVAAAAAAAGYVQYDRNEAYRDFEGRELREVWHAVLEAVHATGRTVPGGVRASSTEGEVDLDGFWTRVEAWPEGYVRVRVRVGTFRTEDHRRKAGLFLDDVAARLGEEDVGQSSDRATSRGSRVASR